MFLTRRYFKYILGTYSLLYVRAADTFWKWQAVVEGSLVEILDEWKNPGKPYMENEKGKKKLTKTASFHNEVCVASWSEGCSEKELRVTETMCYVFSKHILSILLHLQSFQEFWILVLHIVCRIEAHQIYLYWIFGIISFLKQGFQAKNFKFRSHF